MLSIFLSAAAVVASVINILIIRRLDRALQRQEAKLVRDVVAVIADRQRRRRL